MKKGRKYDMSRAAAIISSILCSYYLAILIVELLMANNGTGMIIQTVSVRLTQAIAAALAAFAFSGFGSGCLSGACAFACCAATLNFLGRLGTGGTTYKLFTLCWFVMALAYGVSAFCVLGKSKKNDIACIIAAAAVAAVRIIMFVYSLNSLINNPFVLFYSLPNAVFPVLIAVVCVLFAVSLRKSVKKAFPGYWGTLESIEEDLLLAGTDASRRADVLDRL